MIDSARCLPSRCTWALEHEREAAVRVCDHAPMAVDQDEVDRDWRRCVRDGAGCVWLVVGSFVTWKAREFQCRQDFQIIGIEEPDGRRDDVDSRVWPDGLQWRKTVQDTRFDKALSIEVVARQHVV